MDRTLVVGTATPTRALRADVPWSTVLPLALVLAFADGFWMVSLRSAVGAVERQLSPATAWLRDSALSAPAFALAVLLALTIALRVRAGKASGRRTLLLAGLLVVAFGTVVGTAEVAASAAYDYHLQTVQLQSTAPMSHACPSGGCLDQQVAASQALLTRSVGYAAGLLLATNLVLVAWVTALRGGRLDVVRAAGPRAVDTAKAGTGDRADEWRQVLVVALVGLAVLHAVAGLPSPLGAGVGVTLVVLAAVEVAAAALLLGAPGLAALVTTAAVTALPLAIWVGAHAVRVGLGEWLGSVPPSGALGVIVALLQAVGLTLAVLLLRAGGSPAAASGPTHLRRCALLGILAVTCIGLAFVWLPPSNVL